MKNWTNHKTKIRLYVKEYVDLETSEIITENEFKENYTKTIKNEYRTEYTRHATVTTVTIGGRRYKQSKLKL